MRHCTQILTGLAAGALAATAFAAATPTLAQTVDEITVMGRLGPDGRPQTLSRAVPIGDIDLRYDAGVAEARARVRAAARDVCRELGESSAHNPVGGSCEDNAVRSASDQIRVAIADARSSDYAAVTLVPVPAPAPYAPSAAEEDAAADAAASVGDATADASATVPDDSGVTVTTTTITNGVVPDTPANRARFGGPISNGGRQTAPRGN